MPAKADTVFLFDVDNTLLDNDRFQTDLSAHLVEALGQDACEIYWAIFEAMRAEQGYADYLGAVERLRLARPHDPRMLRIAGWLLDYPYHMRIYPKALDVVHAARRHGVTAILSDGDAVLQPHKIAKSGLGPTVGDNVLVYVHKELELADVEKHLPARHYVLVDDKMRILDAVKSQWGDMVTTVFPRQGQYATDPALAEGLRPADITVEHIAALLDHDLGSIAIRDSGDAR